MSATLSIVCLVGRQASTGGIKTALNLSIANLCRSLPLSRDPKISLTSSAISPSKVTGSPQPSRGISISAMQSTIKLADKFASIATMR